jgi:hypothetical protein
MVGGKIIWTFCLLLFIIISVILLVALFNLLIFLLEIIYPKVEKFTNKVKKYLTKGGVL